MRRGRVIRMFDDRRVVIDLGASDGVEEDMTFGIFTPGDSIIDPDSGETLGTYRRRKATVEAMEVFERFSVVSPPVRRIRERQSPTVALPGMLQPSNWRYERGHLPIDDGQVQPLPTGSEVQLNDIVESLSDPPSEEHSVLPDEDDSSAST